MSESKKSSVDKTPKVILIEMKVMVKLQLDSIINSINSGDGMESLTEAISSLDGYAIITDTQIVTDHKYSDIKRSATRKAAENSQAYLS